MRFSDIQIQNFQMLTELSIDLTQQPITLVAGDNEQGKSSLMEAIRFAITGDTTRVSKKGDIKFLLRDGAKKGLIQLTIAETNSTATVELPKGKVTGQMPMTDLQREVANILLTPELFAAMPEAKRRTLLFDLMGISADREAISTRLAKRHIARDKIEQVKPMLRNGFTAAQNMAIESARDCKSAWKEVTGENWGSQKAENWEPVWENSEVPPEEAATMAITLQNHLIFLEEQIGLAQQAVGIAQSQTQSREFLEEQTITLIDQATSLSRYEMQLRTVSQDLTNLSQKAILAKGSTDPLASAAAQYLHQFLLLSNESTGISGYHQNGDIAAWAEFAELLDGSKELVASISGSPASYGKFEAARSQAEKEVANLKLQIDDSRKAAERLEQIKKTLESMTEVMDQEVLREKIFELQADRHHTAEQAKLMDLIANQQAINNRVLSRATTLHKDIKEWLTIEEAFAPSGIPSELMGDAVKPLNERMRATSIATGFSQVSINNEGMVMVDGRPYSLGSESAQWRADAALAEALAIVSGLRFFALDRVDVLDLKKRPALMKWLHQVVMTGEIEQIFLFGTFKTLPGVPASTFQALWLENGTITNSNQINASEAA
jgi:energy-coupling factor transporter ATP-binding protein EcfA2